MPPAPAPGSARWRRHRSPVIGKALVSGGGFSEQGDPIEVVDRLGPSLTRLAQCQRDDPDAFIDNHYLFGDLATDERFVRAYRSALASLHQRGARATLQSLV